jgi:excisionase family DNA binding protein
MSSTPTTSPRLLTAAQYAAKYGVTRRSVYRWAAAGQLVHVRVGHTVRVPEDQLPTTSKRGD